MIGYRCQYEPYNLKAIELCRTGALGTHCVADFRTQSHCRPVRKARRLAATKGVVRGRVASRHRYLFAERHALPDRRGANRDSSDDFLAAERPRASKRWRRPCIFLLRFPSGALANCQSSYDAADIKRGQVIGTDAVLTLDPLSDYYRHSLTVFTYPQGKRNAGKGEPADTGEKPVSRWN